MQRPKISYLNRFLSFFKITPTSIHFLLAFILISHSSVLVSEVFAEKSYKDLVLNHSEARVLGLDVAKIKDYSRPTKDGISVSGEYKVRSSFSQSPKIINLKVGIVSSTPSRLEKIKFENITSGCAQCKSHNCNTLTTVSVGSPCYSRYKDGYINFNDVGNYRYIKFEGRCEFSVSGLIISVSSGKNVDGSSKDERDEIKRYQDELVDAITQKVKNTYSGDCANDDRDCDGILDCEDLCPTTKGTKAWKGCPTGAVRSKRIQTRSEYILRKQLKSTFECMGISNAEEHASNILFEFDPNSAIPSYRDQQNINFAPKMPTIFASSNHYLNFVLDELKLNCNRKAKDLGSHGSFYHELGHYISYVAGIDKVEGVIQGVNHNTWVKSNPGLAFDEGRADFIMLMMAKKFNRPLLEQRNYGTQHLGKLNNGSGEATEGALTSFWLELYSDLDPCSAMKKFLEMHKQYNSMVGSTPQHIGQWAMGYHQSLWEDYRKSLREYYKKNPNTPAIHITDAYVRADAKLGVILKKYSLSPKFGSIKGISNINGVKDISFDKNTGKKTITILGSLPNKMGVIGPGVHTKINMMNGTVFSVDPLHTEYEVDISNSGVITVAVIKGSVNVKTPDGELATIEQGQSFSWPKLGQISGAQALAPIADSHVYAYSYQNWNKVNWGKYELLGAGWHPAGGEKRAYLKFDFSGIDPKGIDKATLKLFHYHTGGGNSVDLGAYRVTGPWAEGRGTYKPASNALPGEITWINQPSIDRSPVVSFNPGPGTNKWIEVDITPLVKAWLSGIPNHGLVIKGGENLTGKPQAQYGFYAREHEDAEKRPVLVLFGSSTSKPQTGGGMEPSTAIDLACDITSPERIAFITAGETVAFEGSAQGFTDARPSYNWKFGEYGAEPGTSTEQNPGKVKFKFGGSYKTILKVTGPMGKSCQAVRDVLVYDSNDPREFCEGYAELSIEQNEENKRNNCGYTGEQWHSIEFNHQNWCRSVALDQAKSGLRDRDEKLQECISSKVVKQQPSVTTHTGKKPFEFDIDDKDPSVGNKTQQAISLVGNWVDKNGHKVSIAQNGQKVTATAQENKGVVGWKTALGEVKGNTVKMNFNGWKLAGNISLQGKKISWSNNSIWTPVPSGSGFAGQSGTPGDLGKSWDVTEVSSWTGVWTRRGNSNVFDAHWKLGGKQEKAVLTISINGNTVDVKRKQNAGYSYPGQECTYKGTFAADNVTVTGTYGCAWAPGPYNWRATIRGDSGGDSGPTGSTTSSAIKKSHSWDDWDLVCPQPWTLDVSTSGITIGTRKLYRCAYENLSAPLRSMESRPDGSLASDIYNVIFFMDPSNPASLVSRTVRRLMYNTSGNLGSEALINIYYNDKRNRWESANRQYVRWKSSGNKDEEIHYFNLQHHNGIWDSPVKNHTKWYPGNAVAYQYQYEAVENPDHWRSVHTASVSYHPDGRLKMLYEDYLVKQNSDGYWQSFPTHVMAWSGNPSYKNGDFIYEVVQQPSGIWTTFEKKFLTLNNKGEVTGTRLHEIYLDTSCNCYKSRRL